MTLEILQPAAVLILWSIIMVFWLIFTRLPALKKIGVDLTKSEPGGRGQEIDVNVPPSVAWKSHNYTHLMEQPTIFYPVVVILALTGAGTGLNLSLAWAYVILRILHSIYQATVNKIPVRSLLFLVSTLCLLALAVNAVRVTLSL